MEFRQADRSDLPTVKGITERAYSGWVPVLGYPPLPMTDDHSARIVRGAIVLACDEGHVLGLIVVEPGDDHDLIFSIAVDPAHAGRGIGSRLIAEVERRATASGKSCMRLYTNALMQKNITLYLRLSYVEVGRRPNPARPGFTIVDMEKRL